MHPSRPLIAGRSPGGEAADGGRPLTVGLYSPGWPPEEFANGIITYVEAVAEGMARLGHRPVILARKVLGRLGDGDPAPVVDLGPIGEAPGAVGLAEAIAGRLRLASYRELGLRKLSRGLAGACRGGPGLPGLDLIEVEETLGLPGRIAGGVGVPVVARLHGPWFLNGPNQGGDPSTRAFARRVRVEGEALRKVAGVTAPSSDVLERTKAYYGLGLEGSEAIANPVRAVPEGLRWRPEGAEPDRILFVGRFDRHKGGDTILEAFARVVRARPGARLTFVGPDRGLDRDGERWSLPEFLDRVLPGARDDGRVEWLGRRPPSEIAELRRRASATVVASRYETFAITIAEAMAAGCPLVSTRAGGAGELFEDGSHGLYVEPEDPEGMASAVLSLLADPARSAAMGSAAAEHCRRRFAPEVVADRTIRFYRRVLAGAASRRRLPEGARP